MLVKNVSKIKKLTRVAILSAMLCLASSIPAWAAGSVEVKTEKPTANVGDTVKVTMQTSEPEDPSVPPSVTITYDPEVLNLEGCDTEYGGGGGQIIITGTSATLTFTAVSTGTGSVSAEAIIDEDGNNPATSEMYVAVAGGDTAASAPVENAQQGGADATMKAIILTPGEMTPAFSPDVTEYTVVVPEDVEDITVSGGTNDASAQISAASGFKSLKLGENQAIITVTATDGTTLSYHFTIQRGGVAIAEEDDAVQEEAPAVQEEPTMTETGDLIVVIDEITYKISTTLDDSMLPPNTTKESYSYKGYQVEVARTMIGDYVLLHAVSQEDGSNEFFIYNEGNGTYQLYVTIRGLDDSFIVPIAFEESIPDAFEEAQLRWNNSYVPAATLVDGGVDNAESYYLLYAMNQDGEKGFYLYDITEGVYQRFLQYGSAAVVSKPAAKSGKSSYAIFILGALLLVAIMVIINLIIQNHELKLDNEERPKQKPKRRPRPEAMDEERREARRSRPEARDEERREARRPRPEARDEERHEVRKPRAKRVVVPEAMDDNDFMDEEQAYQADAQVEMATEEEAFLELAKLEQEEREREKARAARAQRRTVVPQREVAPAEPVKKTISKPVSRPAKKPALTPEEKVRRRELIDRDLEIRRALDAKEREKIQTQFEQKTPESVSPIFTFDKKPVSLERTAPLQPLDDDFEFEFLGVDDE